MMSFGMVIHSADSLVKAIEEQAIWERIATSITFLKPIQTMTRTARSWQTLEIWQSIPHLLINVSRMKRRRQTSKYDGTNWRNTRDVVMRFHFIIAITPFLVKTIFNPASKDPAQLIVECLTAITAFNILRTGSATYRNAYHWYLPFSISVITRYCPEPI